MEVHKGLEYRLPACAVVPSTLLWEAVAAYILALLHCRAEDAGMCLDV